MTADSTGMTNVEFIGSFECLEGNPEEFIYTITSIKPSDDLRGQENRCWGWFSSLEQAKKAVEINAGDMMETSYRFVVIEKNPSGVVTIAEDVAWYTWTGGYPEGHWQPCEKPSWAEGIVNWSIG